jgi:uncharacterized hydantoinase/oxoprolinase family protein
MRRLARTLCCDTEELGESSIENLAELVKKEIVKRLKETIYEKITRMNLESVLACGIGEKLIETACSDIEVSCVKLSAKYGEFSKLFPAYSMFRLVEHI